MNSSERDGARARRESLGARAAQLSPAKLALLEARRRGESGVAAPSSHLTHASLVPIRPSGSRQPLYCVHPAGGDILCFVAMANHLGAGQACYGFQSQGLYDGTTPLATIQEMATRYVMEMTQLQRQGPYLIAGWSLGGLVAFEMAQQLRHGGSVVGLLAIIDTIPGGRSLGTSDALSEEDFADNVRWLMAIATYVQRLWSRPLLLRAEELKGRPPEDQLTCFLERLKQAGHVASDATLTQLRHLLSVFKANARAWYQYEPQRYEGRITLIRAEGESGADFADASLAVPPGLGVDDPSLGWASLTREPIDLHWVPGDHITLMAEPHVRTLAARLRECANRVIERPPGE